MTISVEAARGLRSKLERERILEASRERAAARIIAADRLPSLLIGAGFLALAVPLAFLAPAERPSGLLVAAVLVAAYALASRVEFEIGAGAAVPTQLVLVPMFFALPPGWVPLLVAAGLVLGNAVDHLTGKRHIGRSVVLLGSSWHSLGPAIVLLLAGQPEPALRHWPIFVAALAAQFAFDFGSAAAQDWLALGVSPLKQLRFLSWVWLVDTVLAPIGLLAALASVGQPYAFLLALPGIGLLALFARERRARVDQSVELSHAYRGTAFLLGDVVEANDSYTGTHSRAVVRLVLQVADSIGLGPRERRNAEFAALLHDVGKIRVPAEIVNKPGPLTDEEWEVINVHTVEGERMLESVGGVLGEVGRIVRSCHERWDGEGYPDGLAGRRIPLVARIVCCCDAFNAMTTDRPYRAAKPVGEAVTELRRCAGTHFDPMVVEHLARVVEGSSGKRYELELSAVTA